MANNMEEKELSEETRAAILENLKYAALAYKTAILFPEKEDLGVLHIEGTQVSVLVGKTSIMMGVIDKCEIKSYPSGSGCGSETIG